MRARCLHFRTAPKLVRTFLTSRVSVSLSSAAGAFSFFFLFAVAFFSVAEVGVAASEAVAAFSLVANEVESGVGAAGVEVPDAGVAASDYEGARVSMIQIKDRT
jgi:hypothetical protein